MGEGRGSAMGRGPGQGAEEGEGTGRAPGGLPRTRTAHNLGKTTIDWQCSVANAQVTMKYTVKHSGQCVVQSLSKVNVKPMKVSLLRTLPWGPCRGAVWPLPCATPLPPPPPAAHGTVDSPRWQAGSASNPPLSRGVIAALAAVGPYTFATCPTNQRRARAGAGAGQCVDRGLAFGTGQAAELLWLALRWCCGSFASAAERLPRARTSPKHLRNNRLRDRRRAQARRLRRLLCQLSL